MLVIYTNDPAYYNTTVESTCTSLSIVLFYWLVLLRHRDMVNVTNLPSKLFTITNQLKYRSCIFYRERSSHTGRGAAPCRLFSFLFPFFREGGGCRTRECTAFEYMPQPLIFLDPPTEMGISCSTPPPPPKKKRKKKKKKKRAPSSSLRRTWIRLYHMCRGGGGVLSSSTGYQPIKMTGSGMYMTGSWKEATLHQAVIMPTIWPKWIEYT